MSGKLDKSLDEILSSSRAGGRAHRSQRRAPGGRAPAPAPIGGVQKSTRPARVSTGAMKANPGGKPAGGSGESKIMISNLPKDVAENMIKNYFRDTVGPVKRTEISCGPSGQSRGMAFVTFARADGASKAFKQLNGLLVDNRPIKIEIIVGNSDAEKIIPPTKTFSDRVSKPKPKPKSAAADKHGGNAGQGAAVKKNPRRRNARPAKKSKEDLDAEMADYFDASAAEAPAGAAAPASGDAAMDDGIM